MKCIVVCPELYQTEWCNFVNSESSQQAEQFSCRLHGLQGLTTIPHHTTPHHTRKLSPDRSGELWLNLIHNEETDKRWYALLPWPVRLGQLYYCNTPTPNIQYIYIYHHYQSLSLSLSSDNHYKYPPGSIIIDKISTRYIRQLVLAGLDHLCFEKYFNNLQRNFSSETKFN